jgi:hypothetical protein
MEDWLTRVLHDLTMRLDGPLHFRFILQPLMSLIFAIRDGVHDAHEHRAAYFWAVCTNSEHRHDLLRSGWKAVSKVFIMAMIIDVIYQVIVFKRFYPVEAILTSVLLALVPYLLLRGPINRITRATMKGGGTTSRPAHQP